MPVHIGLKYTGQPAAHADTTTGVYWEALPQITGHALKIQQALLAPADAPSAKSAAGLAQRFKDWFVGTRK